MYAVVAFGLPATWRFHQHLGSLSPLIVELFDAMCSDDPLSRPLACELLERIRGIRGWHISQETLVAKVPTDRRTQKDSSYSNRI